MNRHAVADHGEVAADLAAAFVVFTAYFLGGRIGLAVPFTSGNVSPLWPPAGIALAAVLLLGYRVWPALALGAFAVNVLGPIPADVSVGIAVGNTAGPLLGAWLVRRAPGFQPSLSRPQDVLRFVILAALGGTAVSATVGTAALFVGGAHAWSGAQSAWLIWWLGDAMGVLVVAPMVMTLPGLHRGPNARRRLELAVLLFAAAGCSILVFGTPTGQGSARSVLSLVLFPIVLSGAMRFGAPGAASVTGVIAATALWATASGRGLFVEGTAFQNATLLQVFLSVFAVSGLLVAALIAERTRLIRDEAEREAARRGEERFREITETAKEGVWILDSRLLTCFVNRRMAEMLGYSVEEMLGKPVVFFMFEEDRARKEEELQRRKRGVSEHLDTRFRRKDGSELWTSASTSGSFDREGRFAGALAMVSDITEQKRREAQGRQSWDAILLLARAVEQTADSVLVTNKRGIIEYVNPAFETTTGYEWGEAVGYTPAILKSGFHAPEFYRELWSHLLAGRPYRGTLVNRKKRGDLYWAEQTITPLRDDEGEITHFVSVLKDVTELRRKQAQEVQLRLAREVQQQFYRPPVPYPGLELAAVTRPMTETGGDYFDVILGPNTQMYIAVGDASGHGLGAALVMTLARAYVRSFASMALDVGEILARVNRMLAGDLDGSRFVTLLLARLDSTRAVLSYASAGHVPGLILGAEGGVRWMPSTGTPLGLFATSTFESCCIPLERDDLMVLVTDGVTESGAEHGDEFGTERLVDHVTADRDRPARQIADRLCEAARRFAGPGPQSDDITSVVVKVRDD